VTESKLLTLSETADRLRVSIRTVQRERSLGHLRAVKIGSRTLFLEREVEAYLAAAYRRSA